MAKRPSLASLSSSVASSSTLSRIAKSPPHAASSLPTGFRTPTSPWPPRSASLSALAQPAEVAKGTDPDDLFTQYSVSEVKNIHQRLRADADAKQEELRLMVGERYRDLLQASTSIISIAQSTKRVLEALDEMKASIPTADEPHLQRRVSTSEKDEIYLKALQSLAAHMKLLLDTPEHLWRLIERKKFLYAAWLFLLARVLHRVLVRENAQDQDEGEESWKAYGIDVTEQFPLAQRQWDTVAQFRSQIIHKATLSLREFSVSVEDICSTLLTLHLLESRPLNDTLIVFLAQRTKGLQLSLSRSAKASLNGHSSQTPNGISSNKSRKAVVREVRENITAVLEVIAMTVGAARDIFSDDGSRRRSLMVRMLEFIQSDSASSHDTSLPPELQISTPNILGSLPSGSQHGVLPPSIRSYKPYIDLASSSSSVSQKLLSDRIQDWFQKAIRELQVAAEKWFSDLKTLKEVWVIRTWVRQWVGENAHLEESERATFKESIDALVERQAVQIWKLALEDVEDVFRAELNSAFTALCEGTGDNVLDASPAKFLFQAPPALSLHDAGVGSAGMISSFRKYESALRYQVTGRTPLLDGVLKAIESRAEALHKDLRAVRKDEGDSRELTAQLNEAYRPDADKLCAAIIDVVSSSMASVTEESSATMSAIVFLGRISNELSSSSFLSNVSCGTDAGNDFQGKAQALRELAVNRWQEYTIRNVLALYRTARESRPRNNITIESLGPSSSLIQALLSMCNSLQNLGMSLDSSREDRFSEATLQRFVTSLLDEVTAQTLDVQTCWDLKFLRSMSELWGDTWTSTIARIDGLTRPDIEPPINGPEIGDLELESDMSEHISRTQILLAPLLPPSWPPTPLSKSTSKNGKPNSLLQFGVPISEHARPAMDLVKPGPRFGLLLVGSNTVR